MLNKDIFIYENETVKIALKKLNKAQTKVLLVITRQKLLLGTISDGDVRRYILTGNDLENTITDVYNKNPKYIYQKDYSLQTSKKNLIENEIELLPIIDDQKKVIDFLTWKDIFATDSCIKKEHKKLDIPAVIMAGGKGSRLDPFTKIFPKPLIPIGDKPIIEIIIDRFKEFGIYEYYLTLNYKGKMIESYFDSIEKDYRINYIKENDFLGTAGSLKLLEGNITNTFIVSNCDVIVKANYGDVIDFHKKNEACLTVLSSIQNHKIPYGVINFKRGGEITKIIEKPEYTVNINTGVYVLNSECLKFIPEKSYFDMPNLIEKLINNKKKVIMYPVNEDDYTDTGQWEEYKNVIKKFNIF